MKIDTTEIAALAQAQADARVDLYGVIHKALRAMMAETLVAVGRLDGRDAAACAHTGEQVRNLLDFCSSHILHENLWVHTAIEARATGASARIAQEHGQHEQHIAALRATLEALETQQRSHDSQFDLFEAPPPPPIQVLSEVEETLAEIDPDSLSPKEALDALYRLKALQKESP